MSNVRWQPLGANGDEFGEDAGGAQREQKLIAIQTLQKCEGSFVLISEHPEGIRFTSALYQKDVDGEEMSEYGVEFLRRAATGIMEFMETVEEHSDQD